MPSPQPTDDQSPPTLDANAVARWQRMAPSASPWLHEEVASRMLDRLQWIKLQPSAWAHWGAVRGGLQNHQKLVKKYPKSLCFVAESQSIHAQAAIKNIAVFINDFDAVSRMVTPKQALGLPVF